MDERKFSEYAPGTLLALLTDAYSRAPEIVGRRKADWADFDAFVYDHLSVLDRCGFVTVEAGTPIGFMSWDPRNLPDSVEIGHNCIVRAHQGKGKGLTQLRIGIDRIGLQNPERIVVRTGAGDFFAPARKMYLTAGFQYRGTTRTNDGLIPETVEYELELAAAARGRKETSMKAIVVYESHWGNTGAVARAVAEGLGPGARALSTAEAEPAAVAGAKLIVAGAPILGFSLPTEKMLSDLKARAGRHKAAPDLSTPSMRAWLERLPKGEGRAAAFDTRLKLTLGNAGAAIARRLEGAGYRLIAKPQRFIVKGTYGPLKDGELERAKAWGAELAKSLG
jgi:hypothetical protein